MDGSGNNARTFSLKRPFDRFAGAVTRVAGSPVAFSLAVFGVVVWALLGPAMRYSPEWQLVINTATTIITFLMVFVIQQSQNKDSIALHLKLDELIASQANASNRVLRAEHLDEDELRRLRDFYCRMAEEADRRRESVQGSARRSDAPSGIDGVDTRDAAETHR